MLLALAVHIKSSVLLYINVKRAIENDCWKQNKFDDEVRLIFMPIFIQKKLKRIWWSFIRKQGLY